MKRIWLGLIMIVLAGPAAAQMQVRFVDAAPDQFSFVLQGACPLGPATLSLDLSGSPAGLLIDMRGGGSVRRIEVIAGADLVTRAPVADHGDTSLEFEISGMEPGEAVVFTIDLDDTRSARPTVVRGWEIEGVVAGLRSAGAEVSGRFAASGVAVIPYSACLS